MFSKTFTEYFHVVFTLPHTLNALAQGNPRVIYTLLFRAATDTLLTFGRDPRHLGGTIGVTAILHTWGQNLSQHVHLHCVVTGGVAPAGTRWIAAKDGFLFPVRALSHVFRAKYLDVLRQAFAQARLTFAAGTADLAQVEAFLQFVAALRAEPWVVYAKRPFVGICWTPTLARPRHSCRPGYSHLIEVMIDITKHTRYSNSYAYHARPSNGSGR